MKTFIYCLIDPRNEAIRYVGKSNDPYKRFKDHLVRAKRDIRRKDRWINSLLTLGKIPELKILEEVDDSFWKEREAHWIAKIRAEGQDLCNHTDGGEGVHNPDSESRQRLSKRRKELFKDPEFRNRMLEILQSPDRRSKLSKALTGKRKTPEHVSKLWQNAPGRVFSDDHKRKISEAGKGKRHTPETIEKIREANVGNTYGKGNKSRTGQKQSDEEKLKKSLALKGRTFSKETIEKMRQARFRYWERKKNGNL